VKVVNDIADTLINKISLAKDMDVLDFGCGTGLLSLRLLPYFALNGSRGLFGIKPT
jgi:cyclopropane fatty-acyl-phospholipid synthase-like methyltransferase